MSISSISGTTAIQPADFEVVPARTAPTREQRVSPESIRKEQLQREHQEEAAEKVRHSAAAELHATSPVTPSAADRARSLIVI